MKDKTKWTDQSHKNRIECAQCDHVFKLWDGTGMYWKGNNGVKIEPYENILLHYKENHPEIYKRRYNREAIIPVNMNPIFLPR